MIQAIFSICMHNTLLYLFIFRNNPNIFSFLFKFPAANLCRIILPKYKLLYCKCKYSAFTILLFKVYISKFKCLKIEINLQIIAGFKYLFYLCKIKAKWLLYPIF